MEIMLKHILNARVYDVAQMTSLDEAPQLSRKTGNKVLLKREDLQPCFSFKIRGAYNKICHLNDREREAGVICASAGNHAQGVAISAVHLGISAVIVMPRTTPQIKVDAVRRMGGEVVLHGDNYSEAAEYCAQLVKETGRTFIHPFDDPLVIAGQGTVGHEILQQCPDPDVIFVPVGGGGLISGVAAFFKSVHPRTQIIGVEPEDSNAMQQSLASEERVVLSNVGLFADGVAVKQVGELTFDMTRKCVDQIITVTTDETCSAIKAIYEDTRSIMEPAGALGVAGLKKYVKQENLSGKILVSINSGANMNFDRLQFVAERTLTGERREALFAVTIPEKPGSLRFFCDKLVGDRSITEFNYRLFDRREAHIFVGIGLSNEEERRVFGETLERHGFKNMDITENELAKTHVRHMVGGRSINAMNEMLYRFQFPERPRAMMDFLNAMSPAWNISLFHYRMHGADFGRVLVGFEIPESDKEQFQRFLQDLQYPYLEETGNPAYMLFLGNGQ
ncbi:MAG: threonine ammonia-lyase, biosynthetic [Deltaproteobacteria bacterium]|nr:threonine ammonia-lyase, biosynthetic [Deltaproteobacteria bacterium]